MGRLLEAVKNQEKALAKLEQSWYKWSLPSRFDPKPIKMPGDDAFGKRPNVIQERRDNKCHGRKY